jgi:hypothetical protein
MRGPITSPTQSRTRGILYVMSTLGSPTQLMRFLFSLGNSPSVDLSTPTPIPGYIDWLARFVLRFKTRPMNLASSPCAPTAITIIAGNLEFGPLLLSERCWTWVKEIKMFVSCRHIWQQAVVESRTLSIINIINNTTCCILVQVLTQYQLL